MYALQTAITVSRALRLTSCASMLGIASTTPKKPTPSMMRAARQNKFVRCAGPDHIANGYCTHPADQRPPNTQSAHHDTGTDSYRGPERREDRHNQPARSRPSAKSSRINGMDMMALPICAEATTPLPMSSNTP